MRCLPRTVSATGTSVASTPLRRKVRLVPKKRFFKLLRESGTSADAAAFDVLLGCHLDRVPIEPTMLVEAPVLGGDDSMLKIGRDLAEGHEPVLLLIWRAVKPGLHTALHLQHGGWRVNPPGGDEKQRGKRPKGYQSNGKPSDKGPED